MATTTWSTEEDTFRFIEQYQNEPVIWNLKHMHHKEEAADSPAEEHLDIQDESNDSAQSSIQISTRKRPRQNSIDLQEIQTQAATAIAKIIPALTTVTNEFNTLTPLANLLDNTEKEPDDCELYGRLTAMKLKELPETERQEIMYQIHGLLLNRLQTGVMNEDPLVLEPY